MELEAYLLCITCVVKRDKQRFFFLAMSLELAVTEVTA